jgi:arginyl-tRNA synthetase
VVAVDIVESTPDLLVVDLLQRPGPAAATPARSRSSTPPTHLRVCGLRCGPLTCVATRAGRFSTTFGLVDLGPHRIEGEAEDIGEAEAAHELSVGDLNGFYQAARRTFDSDHRFKERARRRVVLLQSGDAVTRRLWEVLVGESKKYFATVYSRLDVRLTDSDYFGESY